MQPTVSPWAWVSSWERRARTRGAGEYSRGAGEYTRERAPPRRATDNYAFYGLRKDGRHFIRLDPLAKGLLLSRQWGTGAPVTWRVDRFHDAPWAVPDVKSIQSFRPYEPVSIVLPGGAGGGAGAVGAVGAGGAGRGAPPAHAWSHGARGWAAGAVLLALLVLLVRAAENCLHKKLFRAIYMHTNAGAAEMQQDQVIPGHYRLQGVRRQESEEWSTPNVMATSLQLHHRDFDADSVPRLDDIEGLSSPQRRLASDMPPPYSACAARPAPAPAPPPHKFTSEEPPPPYSACYVAYSPKDAEPQVHIRRHNALDERTDSTTDNDNVQNDLIENGLRAASAAAVTPTGDEQHATGMRTEFVFDNGRILERLSLDLSSNSEEAGVASNDNVQVQSARPSECSDRVVYIDETPAENTTPDRAMLV